MTSLSFRDFESLSAYLDGQLSPNERARLEARLQSDSALAAALKELHATRALLRRTPARRAPRNFRLTSKMAGIRPPVPRIVPVFSWASAVAMILFIFTLGASLVGQLAVGTTAPMLAAAPSGAGNALPPQATSAPVQAAPATAAPATAAPVLNPPATSAPVPSATATIAPFLAVPATQVPAPQETDQTKPATPTPEPYVMSVPEATQPGALRASQPPAAPKAQPKPLSLWLVIWPSLGVLLGALALLIRWVNRLAFRRKNRPR